MKYMHQVRSTFTTFFKGIVTLLSLLALASLTLFSFIFIGLFSFLVIVVSALTMGKIKYARPIKDVQPAEKKVELLTLKKDEPL